MKKMLASFLIASAAAAWGAAAPTEPVSTPQVKVVCVGDSITEGAKLADPARDCYPARMQAELGGGFKVYNCGLSYRTLQHAGDFPIWNDEIFTRALALQPDIVLIKLGTNDSKPQNWKNSKERFLNDAREMVGTFQRLKSAPRVIIVLPVPAFHDDPAGISGAIVRDEIVPAWRQVAFETGAELLDLHTPMLKEAARFPDNIHPDAQGAVKMGRIAARYITEPRDLDFDLAGQLPSDAAASDFRGYRAYEFQLDGRKCKVVCPKPANSRRSWVWQYSGSEPQADSGLLEDGFHLFFVDPADPNASPAPKPAWEAVNDFAARTGLEKK